MTRHGRTFIRRRLDVVVGLVGLAVLAVCAAVAHDGTVGTFERRLFEAIKAFPRPSSP